MGPPIRIELGRGIFCPNSTLVFRNTTCPGGALELGNDAKWIGHAVVTFAGSSEPAYLDLVDDRGMQAIGMVVTSPPPLASPS